MTAARTRSAMCRPPLAADLPEPGLVWCPSDAVLGDDGAHVTVGCDVERRVGGHRPLRGDGLATDGRDLVRRAFFDGDVLAAGKRQVDCADWRRDVEGHFILIGEDGDLV